jgi:hypothetical protein
MNFCTLQAPFSALVIGLRLRVERIWGRIQHQLKFPQERGQAGGGGLGEKDEGLRSPAGHKLQT